MAEVDDDLLPELPPRARVRQHLLPPPAHLRARRAALSCLKILRSCALSTLAALVAAVTDASPCHAPHAQPHCQRCARMGIGNISISVPRSSRRQLAWAPWRMPPAPLLQSMACRKQATFTRRMAFAGRWHSRLLRSPTGALLLRVKQGGRWHRMHDTASGGDQATSAVSLLGSFGVLSCTAGYVHKKVAWRVNRALC